MFAVVKADGKQYQLSKGETLAVARINAESGDQFVWDQVLMLNDGKSTTVGAPFVTGAGVLAQVKKQTRGEKITIIKKRRRQNSRRKQGHIQDLTLVEVIDIAADGAKKFKPSKAATSGATATKKAATKKADSSAEAKKAKPADKDTATKSTAVKKTVAKSAKEEAKK